MFVLINISIHGGLYGLLYIANCTNLTLIANIIVYCIYKVSVCILLTLTYVSLTTHRRKLKLLTDGCVKTGLFQVLRMSHYVDLGLFCKEVFEKIDFLRYAFFIRRCQYFTLSIKGMHILVNDSTSLQLLTKWL